jgi:hypothetical protein
MKVFKLAQDITKYTALAMVHEPDISISFEFDGRPLRQTWRPLAVRPITEEFPELTTVGDFTKLGTIPVFSKRAVDGLGELLTDNGELLPLEPAVEGMRYYAYNVTTVLNALDRDRTAGVWLAPDRLMLVDRYAFRPECLTGATVFRIPELQGTVFVTEKFIDRVVSSGIDGVAPELVWSVAHG